MKRIRSHHNYELSELRRQKGCIEIDNVFGPNKQNRPVSVWIMFWA